MEGGAPVLTEESAAAMQAVIDRFAPNQRVMDALLSQWIAS
jgi:hypothetical protein